jgi:hypothetical protein
MRRFNFKLKLLLVLNSQAFVVQLDVFATGNATLAVDVLVFCYCKCRE